MERVLLHSTAKPANSLLQPAKKVKIQTKFLSFYKTLGWLMLGFLFDGQAILGLQHQINTSCCHYLFFSGPFNFESFLSMVHNCCWSSVLNILIFQKIPSTTLYQLLLQQGMKAVKILWLNSIHIIINCNLKASAIPFKHQQSIAI